MAKMRTVALGLAALVGLLKATFAAAQVPVARVESAAVAGAAGQCRAAATNPARKEEAYTSAGPVG